MDKHARQFAIREIIAAASVASQDELRVALKTRGFKVTQATLSRDLHELGVSWVSTTNGGRYTLQGSSEAQILRPIVGSQVVSIRANESVIVIHTLPGCANVVGEFIDSLRVREIIGTIAGDNTLLVIPQSHRKTARLLSVLKEKLIEG